MTVWLIYALKGFGIWSSFSTNFRKQCLQLVDIGLLGGTLERKLSCFVPKVYAI